MSVHTDNLKRMLLCLLALNVLAVASEKNQAPAIKFVSTLENAKYVFAVAPPVARVKPGQVIEVTTLDAFGNLIQKPGDGLAKVKGFNPLAGPFYVEGAEPGDALVVNILDVKVNSNQGIGAMAPGFGALNSSFYTPMLNPELPERIWFYSIDNAKQVAVFRALDSSFTREIPLHPFVGSIGVAPPLGEARSSITPGEWGGNMDAPEISAGHTLYLPVNAPGALLYLGDAHAAQGDGEVGGTAIEVPAVVRLQVSVQKKAQIHWPRLENAESIMAVGATRPLDDSLRIAFTELVAWINRDYGLSKIDAYQLLSQVGKIHVTEMVDPNYVVIASIEKKYLPEKKRP